MLEGAMLFHLGSASITWVVMVDVMVCYGQLDAKKEAPMEE